MFPGRVSAQLAWHAMSSFASVKTSKNKNIFTLIGANNILRNLNLIESYLSGIDDCLFSHTKSCGFKEMCIFLLNKFFLNVKICTLV